MPSQWPENYVELFKREKDYLQSAAARIKSSPKLTALEAVLGFIVIYRWWGWCLRVQHIPTGYQIDIPYAVPGLLLMMPLFCKLVDYIIIKEKIDTLKHFEEQFPNFSENFDWQHPLNPHQVCLFIMSSKDHNQALAPCLKFKKNLLSASKKYSIALRTIDSPNDIKTCISEIMTNTTYQEKNPTQIQCLFLGAHADQDSMDFSRGKLNSYFLENNHDLFSLLPLNVQIMLFGCNTAEEPSAFNKHSHSIARQIAQIAAPRKVHASINKANPSVTDLFWSKSSEAKLNIHFNRPGIMTKLQHTLFGRTLYSSSTRTFQLEQANPAPAF
ncbi:hypothetical protein [Legionella yabuuchiae]|uniref:hypothetical protein n=1 Tax=Legionella yabuuchiae TaxID=376727 RepID=UPI001054E6CD|nr:hypothetical protein [Legionella yabuuchiae]